MRVVTHRARTLEVGDAAVYVYRPDVFALCQRHEIDPHDTERIELLRPRSLRFTLYNRNADGHRYVDPATGDVAVRTVDVLRWGNLPAWWQPGRIG